MTLHSHCGMTIAGFQRQLVRGDSDPLDWWLACQNCIKENEDDVQAWEYIAKEIPDPADTILGGAFLKGVPVGIKDIIETCDMPTAWGTGGYLRTSNSLVDAPLVTLLKQQGAMILGKTVSTELAFFTPGKTRNPHDLTRTPGGSSSGSAAAVAAGMVPLAFGTQTAGSIIRPASYCGVFGFKPTFGTVSFAGVKSFAPSLDTIGWFANHIDDICTTFSALTRAPVINGPHNLRGVRIGMRSLPGDQALNADAWEALKHAQARFEEAGAIVTPLALDSRFDALVVHQKVVMAYEAAQTLASEYLTYSDKMGSELVALIEEGKATPYAHYTKAKQTRDQLQHALTAVFANDVDVILAASASGVAPKGLEATGDPLFCRAWTLLGVPCLNLPLSQSDQGLPIGVQLIGGRFEDVKLLSIAHALIHQQ